MSGRLIGSLLPHSTTLDLRKTIAIIFHTSNDNSTTKPAKWFQQRSTFPSWRSVCWHLFDSGFALVPAGYHSVLVAPPRHQRIRTPVDNRTMNWRLILIPPGQKRFHRHQSGTKRKFDRIHLDEHILTSRLIRHLQMPWRQLEKAQGYWQPCPKTIQGSNGYAIGT